MSVHECVRVTGKPLVIKSVLIYQGILMAAWSSSMAIISTKGLGSYFGTSNKCGYGLLRSHHSESSVHNNMQVPCTSCLCSSLINKTLPIGATFINWRIYNLKLISVTPRKGSNVHCMQLASYCITKHG